jgi:hypothetical protein
VVVAGAFDIHSDSPILLCFQIPEIVAGARFIFPVQQISFFYLPLRLGNTAIGSFDEIFATSIDIAKAIYK